MSDHERPDPALMRLLDDSTTRLVRHVDEMPDEAYPEPSLLPGWSRGHVVAHLALNAHGMADALHTIADGGTGAFYPSQRARDTGVIELAAEGPPALRETLLAGVSRLSDALGALPEERWSGGVERVPGSGVALQARELPFARTREIEIHLADLDAGYGPQDWSAAFAELAVDSLRARAGGITLLATDLGRSWHAEPGHTTVSGPAPLLAWWLSGRGQGEGLTSNGGDLPQIQEW